MWLHAPEELTCAPLQRLGEGIGKVVYASPHWVVKQERHPAEVMALILIWKMVRRLERFLPAHHLRPLQRARILRFLLAAILFVVPKGLWMMTHAGEVWRTFRQRDREGERLQDQHLAGSGLVPERISFPPTRVQVAGWPGWITVSEATQRVECTLEEKLRRLAAAGDYGEVELWLNRWIELRRAGWSRGVFSLDVHLKNFGVTDNRVVLIDPGGLTNDWRSIEKRLTYDGSAGHPHVQLGLGALLHRQPDIAMRFDEHWRATVNARSVQSHWPGIPD